MESGVFDFQPDTYVRAFLKEYAKAINENENQILTDYEKAKSGFYKSKTVKKEVKPITHRPVIDKEDKPEKLKPQPPAEEKKEEIPEPEPKIELSPKEIQTEPSQQIEQKEEVFIPQEEYSSKTITQKVLLGLLILIVLAGIVYLYYYLNRPDEKYSTVKPKSFSEISDDYETKVKGKTVTDTTAKQDTTKTVTADSLRLTIKAFRDVRIKVYLDENKTIDDIIYSKDSLVLKAKQQFRFSASANSSIELYLNNKLLKKPSSLTGTSIKNLVINKSGIVNQ
jgi:cytoskeletal protein RodZ